MSTSTVITYIIITYINRAVERYRERGRTVGNISGAIREATADGFLDLPGAVPRKDDFESLVLLPGPGDPMLQSLSHAQASRRSLAKGLAWTFPAVTIAALAPSVAASGVPVQPTTASAVCKLTGNGGKKVYQFSFVFSNTSGTSSTVCISSGTMSPSGCASVSINTSSYSPASGCATVTAGGTVTITADSMPATCFANGTASLTYTSTYQGQTLSTTATVSFPSLPPC